MHSILRRLTATTVLCIAGFPCAAEALSGIRIRPEAAATISRETVEKAMEFRSETSALRFLAAICISNRQNVRAARRSLDANSFVHFADMEDRSEMWIRPPDGPALFLLPAGRRIDLCSVNVGKPATRFENLEDLLDELTEEDIQRIGRDILGGRPGEKGWVLRPGFEHAVYIHSVEGTSSISLSLLD